VQSPIEGIFLGALPSLKALLIRQTLDFEHMVEHIHDIVIVVSIMYSLSW